MAGSQRTPIPGRQRYIRFHRASREGREEGVGLGVVLERGKARRSGLPDEWRGGFRTCDLSRVKRDQGGFEEPPEQERLF